MSPSFLKPFSQNHSIREAVITLFLANPIIKPERFRELITSGMSTYFHLYENVSAVQFQFKATETGILHQPQSQQNTGFKFLGFNKGKISKTLQGINEINRTFISFHSFEYSRWNIFVEEYIRVLKVLVDFHTDIFVKAVSVHYIDEFNWIDDLNSMDLNKVFNNEAKYMSKAFLESSNNANFIYTSEKKEESFGLRFDRLEIKVDSKVNKNISISHNGTLQFDDLKSLESLVGSDNSLFMNTIQTLHDHNKQILKDILDPTVKSLINIT